MINKIKYFILIMFMFSFSSNSLAKYDKLAYDFSFNDLDGTPLKLSSFKDRIIVVVNVASQCGFTNQYKDLQTVWEKYQSKKLVVIGVPSNDFGNQEPGNSNEIKTFCEAKFGITFPITEKIKVKGDNAHPFYIWAKKNYGNSAVPKWNFYKIIIGKDGKIAKTFTSMTNPSSKKFTSSIEELIK